MPRNVLVKNSDKYQGKYVATRSFKDRKAVCSGRNPVKVLSCAKEKGIRDPVVFYVPKKNSVNIY